MNSEQAPSNKNLEKSKKAYVYTANMFGLAIIILFALLVTSNIISNFLEKNVIANLEETGALIRGLYRIVAGIIVLFLPYRFLKSAGKRVKLSIPMGAGKISFVLILPLFFGGMIFLNAVINLLKILYEKAFSIEAKAISELPEGALAVIIYFIARCVVPAIFEELLFRGAMQGVIQRWGARFSIIVTSVFFAAMHINPWNFLSALCLGAVLSYVRYITDSLSYCMVLHFINNSVMFLMLVVSEKMSGVAAFGFSFWIILIALLMFAMAIYTVRSKKMREIFVVEKNRPVVGGKYTRAQLLSSSVFFIAAAIIAAVSFILQTIFFS